MANTNGTKTRKAQGTTKAQAKRDNRHAKIKANGKAKQHIRHTYSWDVA